MNLLQIQAVLVAILCGCAIVEAENILAMYPVPARSHWFAVKPLFLELTRRGHNITLVAGFVDKDLPSSWEIITVESKPPPNIPRGVSISGASRMKGAALYDFLVAYGIYDCDELLKGEPLQKVIKMEKKFDLFMMNYFHHNCLLAMAHKFGIPVILLHSAGGFPLTSDAVGEPYPPAYAPDLFLDFTDHMTFWQRLVNVWTVTYGRYKYYWQYIPKADEIVRRHFGDPSIPSIAELESRTSLVLVQSHPSFSYPRPHLPNVIETGGMQAQSTPNIPKELKSVMDEAKDGVIYFSMGSMVKSSEFPADKLQAFIQVFAKLKQLVLWKWDGGEIEGKPPNVKVSKWYPQSDLLAHKNVKLFISHGGLQSTLETTSRGVPIVGIPVMGEQMYNVERAAAAGYAVRLDIENITAQSVEWAITEVLSNPAYREKAQQRSRLFHDRPQKAVDTAVFWTEYVLRHQGAPHLRSAALDLAWYQLLLLDVVAALLLGAAVVVTAAYLAISKTYAVLCARTPGPHSGAKSKKE